MVFKIPYITLLENIFQYRNNQTNTLAIIILFIIILVIAAFALFARNRARNQKTRKRYNKYVARKTAANIGLKPQHTELMEKLVRSLKIAHPVLLYSNRRMLENFLKNSIELIERLHDKSDEEKAMLIKYIYEIKEIIEIHSKKGIGLKSTHLIKPEQPFLIITQEGEKFRTKVVNNLSSMLICSHPVVSKKHHLNLKRGMHLKVLFWRENDSGYSFTSRIAGFDSRGEYSHFYIRHANKLVKEQQRKHHRKPIKVSCFLYPVEIIRAGKKNKPSDINVQYDLRFMGVIKDISARGCRIATKHAFAIDQFIKLDFSITRKDNISAIGKVRNVQTINGQGVNMSIAFRQISNGARNQIYSYIFSRV